MAEDAEAEIRRYTQQLAADPKSRVFIPLADIYRRSGRYEEAIAVAREGVSKHPTYVTGRVALARALFEYGDAEGAREHLEWVLKFAPDNLLAGKLLDEVRRTGKPAPEPPGPDVPPEAQAAAAQAVRPEAATPPPAPREGSVRTATLAELYRSQGHYEQAIALYRELGLPEKIADVEREIARRRGKPEAAAGADRKALLERLLERVRSRKRREHELR